MLNYRGERGVATLYDAFIETQNENLAESLAPYVNTYIADKKNNRNKTEPKGEYTFGFKNIKHNNFC